jgi:hypothetical protein
VGDVERQPGGTCHAALLPDRGRTRQPGHLDGKNGTIRIYDLPSASALFEEMHFETAIVAVNADKKGTDKIVRVFTWGNSKQGTVQQHKKGDKIANQRSHLQASNSPSRTFKKILKNDYPTYKYK